MSAASGQCGACKKDFCVKVANPHLCLTQCGHIFHKECIFVADSNDKVKVLACPTCMSHELRPVILIYPSLAENEESFANPKQYHQLARSVPPIIGTGGERYEENMQTTVDIHSTLVSDFNDLLAKTLEEEKLCQDTIASNAELEREIAALKEMIEEQKREIRRMLKRDSSGQQVGINERVAVKIEPEYPNHTQILNPDETDSEDEIMHVGIEVVYSDDDLFAEEDEEEVDDEEEVEEEEQADDAEDDMMDDPDFELHTSDTESDGEL